MGKRLSFVIVLSLIFSFSKVLEAQNCVENFIEDVLNVAQINNKKFYEKAVTTVKSHSNDYFDLADIRFLNIPVVFSTRKGAKIANAGNLDKEKLLCYLNGKSLVFDEALVVQDTIVFGAVIQSSNPAFDLEFIRDIDLYRVQLAKVIMEINPDIIFSIYNIPRCYWFVKDNDFFVLYYERESTEKNFFVIYNAKSFIEEHLNKEELFFLSYRRVIVVSGR